MKIECPNCHVTGQIKEEEIPLEGRLVICPKCSTSFQVKRPPKKWSPYMMNTCPKCAYSTFSEETFAVCPKCGLDGERHHLERQHREAAEKANRANTADVPPPPLATPIPTPSKYTLSSPKEEAKIPPPNVPWPVSALGGAFAVIGLAGLFWGSVELYHYYGKDWIKEIYDQTGEQVTGAQIFLKYGFFPWVKIAYGICTLFIATMYLKLKRWAQEKLEWCAWGLLMLLGGNEVWAMVAWFRRASSNPSFTYYLTGLADCILMTGLWSAITFGALWGLRHEEVERAFRKFGND